MAFTDTIFRWLGFARYNATLPAVATTGNVVELQCDAYGRLLVVTQSQTPGAYSRGIAVNSLSVKASAGSLVELWGFNDDSSTKYVMIFNTASAPSGSTGLIEVIRVPAGSAFAFSPGVPLVFSTGIQVAVSTTPTTLTADVASKTTVTVAYQ